MLTQPPIFVGRARELDRLASALALVAVAVITGVAGVGKSTLARAHASRWPGPVAVVTLRPGTSIALLCEDVHRQLGVDLAADDAGLAQLWALIDARGALLVIDELHAWDAEQRSHVIRSALAGLARGRLLAVSRELVALGPGDPDRLELRLEGLDRASAACLWQSLLALYGPAHDFEAAWQRSCGNPLLLRQAHAGRGGEPRPLDGWLETLTPAEHALAMLIAVSQSPLPAAVVATDPRVLQALATRLVVELDGDGHYVLHALVRDQLLRTAAVPTARRRLVAALHDAPAIGVVLRVRETARQLRALGDEPAIAALIQRHAHALGADAVLRHELDALAPEARTPAIERLHARVRCSGLGPRRAYQRLASVVDDTNASFETRLCLASVATWAGELERALALFDALAAEAAEAADAALRERIQLGRAWAEATRGARTAIAPHGESAHALRLYEACLAGRTVEAADLASELVARLQTRPAAPWSRAMLTALCGIALAREGWFDEAERALDGVDVGAVERVEHAWARAVIAGERGDRIAAIATLTALLPAIDRGGLFIGAMWTRVILIRLHLQLGRRTAAGTLASEARALARNHGSTAFDAAIAHAEREDLLAFAEVAAPAALARTPAARLRHQLHAALVAACDERASPPAALDIPDRIDFALDHAALALAHAEAARRRGELKLTQSERARATELAAHCGADRELIAQLFDQLRSRDGARPGDPPMQIDATRHELRVGALCRSLVSRVSLRGLLYAFAAAADQQLDRDAIAHALWHTSYDPLRHDSSLKSSIRRLRSLLVGTGAAVESVVDGYRLVLPPEATFVPPAAGAAARSFAG